MDSIKLLSNRELKKLTNGEKIEYFDSLKEYCENFKKIKINNICHNIITKIYPLLRNYDYEIIGQEHIPKDGKALFICNHSNSHDFFTAHEVFEKMGTNVSVFAASDDISLGTQLLFKGCDSVMIDRNDKVSSKSGLLELSSHLLSGVPGVIFSEATWNLHPIKPMQNIKVGGINISAITEIPIIPTIFEYIESPKLCLKESELIEHCVIKFGNPIKIFRESDLIVQTNNVKKILEQMRIELWNELGMIKENIMDVNQILYLNHTYLKKFCSLGFKYDSLSESMHLLSINEEPVDNEYFLNENGEFLPGITTELEGKKYIKKI